MSVSAKIETRSTAPDESTPPCVEMPASGIWLPSLKMSSAPIVKAIRRASSILIYDGLSVSTS